MASSPLLRLDRVSKRFDATVALDEVSFEARAGEVHAILGENGAGKTTLVEAIAGLVRPDSGEVFVEGRPMPLGRPAVSRSMGVRIVHQHSALVPEFTVAENLALRQAGSLAAPLDLAKLVTKARKAAERLGWEFEPNRLVRDLGVGLRQRIEILDALADDSRILILDEPTAVLSAEQSADLVRVLRSLAQEGKLVVLIAHKLSEVLQASDRVSVLRRGRHEATRAANAVSRQRWVADMLGETPEFEPAPGREAKEVLLEAVGLRVLDDRGEPTVRGLDFQLRRGEIFGVGGVDGNGQVELAEAVAGIRELESGQLRWTGSPKIAYIPQDRHRDGLALQMSVSDNLLLGRLDDPRLRWGPFVVPGRVRNVTENLASAYEVRGAGLDADAASLSGGNQQKLVVARALSSGPELIVAVNPTRGLDVKSESYVHARLQEAAARGACVFLVSADRDELASLADRVRILSRGVWAADFADALTGDAPP